MATKADPKRRKSKEPLEETDVILVVKGAGEQAEDDHLNIFLRGFWPAIKSLDKNATLTQVTAGFDDYPPSPHNSDGKSQDQQASLVEGVVLGSRNPAFRRAWESLAGVAHGVVCVCQHAPQCRIHAKYKMAERSTGQ